MAPTRPPKGEWTVGSWRGPIWNGGRCERLVIDLSAGGLGDAVRMFPILAALRRMGRPGGEILVVTRPGAPGTWVARALAPTRVVPVHADIDGDAVIPPIHMFPAIAWKTWPDAPLTALVGRALGIPMGAMAGPCLRINQVAYEQLNDRLDQSGWDGVQPLVGLQTDGHATGTVLNQLLQREKVPASIRTAAPELRRQGLFPVLIGGESHPDSSVPDFGGCPLELLVALIHRCDLTVTGDSGPMHISAAVGTPTLALFGPTDPRLHVCGASVRIWEPPLNVCPRIPCGAGSLLGGPVTPDARERLPLPCPPLGGCLSRSRSETIVQLVVQTLEDRVPMA